MQISMFKRQGPSVALLRMPSNNRRADEITYGVDYVLSELSVDLTRYVTPDCINDADIVLASFLSPQDVLTFADQVGERPKSRLIVGGQGVYPFLAWRHLAHRIAFGRVEDAVDDCILTSKPQSWCYDYDSDPDIAQRYEIRQARRLLPGEQNCGCNGSCRFCQYGATRRQFGAGHSTVTRGARVLEDRWCNLQVRPGQQTTALDGWSAATRKKVGKPVSDEQIVDGLSRCLDGLRGGTMMLKVFQIVGYPWETAQSITEDVLLFGELLHRVHPPRDGSRIMMMFTITPFSPEPLTAMEDEPADIHTAWRDVLWPIRRVFDQPHLNAFILPQIPGSLTLYRRVAVNRSDNINKLRAVSRAKTIEEAVQYGGDLHLPGAGVRVSRVLSPESRHMARSA